MSLKIKKNDMVKILSGKDRGKSGRVLDVVPQKNRVVVEGANIRKRHRRAKKQGEKGQIIQMPSPLHVSGVMLICPSCSKPQRTKMVIENGKKMRTCRKCGAKII